MHLSNNNAEKYGLTPRVIEPYQGLATSEIGSCDATSSDDFLTPSAEFVSVNLSMVPAAKRAAVWQYLKTQRGDLAELLKDDGVQALKAHFNGRIRVAIAKADAISLGLCA